MVRLVASIALVLVLSGCAAIGMKRPVAQEDLATTKRVGVVSVLGNEFHVVHIGFTAFENRGFSEPVDDWGIEKYATARTLELLRGTTRFESGELDLAGPTTVTMLRKSDGTLWEAASRQGYDRLVALRKGVSDNYAFFRPGYGLFERSAIGPIQRCVYAAYVVEVYDVASREQIAWEWGGGKPCDAGVDNDIPLKWKFSEYSDQERQLMRQRLEKRLRESLRYSLEKLNLLALSAPAK